MGPWTHGPLDPMGPWTQWALEPMGPWTHGPLDPWKSLKLKNQGPLGPPGTLGDHWGPPGMTKARALSRPRTVLFVIYLPPLYTPQGPLGGSKGPWVQGPMGPRAHWVQGPMGPRAHGSMGPWVQGPPRDPRAPPWDPRAPPGIPGFPGIPGGQNLKFYLKIEIYVQSQNSIFPTKFQCFCTTEHQVGPFDLKIRL